MFSVIILLLVLSLLVFVHELGHFVVAKKAGMKVEEFGFGFPPRIFGIRKGETLYSLNWIPLGGFVKILGEDGSETSNPRSFAAAKPGVRFAVIVAGVVMNVFLAIFLLTLAGSVIGLRINADTHPDAALATDIRIEVIYVNPDAPAQEAGIRLYDEIVALSVASERVEITTVLEVQEFIGLHLGEDVGFEISRGNDIKMIEVIPRVDIPEGEGATGISMRRSGNIKYPLGTAFVKSLETSGRALKIIPVALGGVFVKLFTSGPGAVEGIAGPIGIAVITGQAARAGSDFLIQLVAILSLNLAVLNALPITPLDGGKMLFIILEKIKGRPVSVKYEKYSAVIGLFLLLILIVLATSKDIINFL